MGSQQIFVESTPESNDAGGFALRAERLKDLSLEDAKCQLRRLCAERGFHMGTSRGMERKRHDRIIQT